MCGPQSRPEPVDPSRVRVGDYVEVVQEHDDIPLRITVEGEVYQLGRDGDSRHLFYIRGYGGPAIADVTTVRVLRRAEPEPDPAAVEALRQVMRDTFRAGSSPGVELDEEWIERHALALAKRNVRVVTEIDGHVAVVKAERETCTCTPHPYGDGPEPDCSVHGAVRALNEANAAIERARTLHLRVGSTEQNGYCIYDNYPWPCSTIRALDGTEVTDV